MSDNKTYKLKNIGKIITGKTPKTSNLDFFNGKYMFITPNDLHGTYRIIKTPRTLSDSGLKSIQNNTIDNTSILVGCIGDVGMVRMCFDKCATNQQINSITDIKDFCNPYYLYYYLSNKKELFKNIALSTVVPIIPKTIFQEIEILLPNNIETQQKIARTLSVLDQKIENNHKINELLHKILELLYEQYFVRFDFSDENNKPYQTSGGKMKFSKELNRLIPNDFEVKTLGELTQLKVGNKNANHSSNQGKYPFFTCSNNPLKCETYQFEGKHIIISGNGNFYVTHYDGKFDAYQRTYVVNPNNPNHYVLIYLFVKSYTNYLKLQSRGSIIKFITKSDIENIKIVLPNLKIYTKWNNVLKMIENNMQSTQTLTALRDFLLPLLLKQQVKPQ
ncbi:restriction endonuclease subunit S [Helicobacter pylori]|uniref:restriction endonuclease subunit S n=1 Tax=Helicobacter pylori TaxID=210 RepID=UPI0013F498D4|nr:restriction endonuclease subunit S [Helicobacter pylori]NHA97929.1 restriction endonuclease subunit S [Helicobacter pylori]NHB01388.1 restriction endonuclease subunit S [Helicobacter pylori]